MAGIGSLIFIVLLVGGMLQYRARVRKLRRQVLYWQTRAEQAERGGYGWRGVS